jgi:diguanylate cyclase (GGDEF)-like protein
MQANLYSRLLDMLGLEKPTPPGFFSRGTFSRLLLQWAAAGMVYFLASCVGIRMAETPGDANFLWPANGLLLSILLLSPRRTWTGYLLIGFLASLFSHTFFPLYERLNWIFAFTNIVEILIAATLLGQPGSVRPDLAQPRMLGRFVLVGILLAPLSSAVLVSLLRWLAGLPANATFFWHWYLGDSLGIAIMTPLLLAIQPDKLRILIGRERRLETILLLFGLTATSTCVFAQRQYPLTFLLFPALLLIVFRLRISGSAIGIFLLSIPAAWFTVHSRGPFSLIRPEALVHSVFLLQCLFGVCLVIIYAVSAALEERDRLQQEITIAYRQADVMAALDHVTGLANRRTFDKELSREWNRAIRERTSLTLLMIDIDHFKNYNDYYGHIAGDQCLQTIASIILKSMVRSTDLPARYGGEEFAVILPGSHGDGAKIIAERLREAIIRASLPHEGSTCAQVSISIGVATVYPTRETHEIQLIEAADYALYQAKRNGRNQVAVWRSPDIETNLA